MWLKIAGAWLINLIDSLCYPKRKKQEAYPIWDRAKIEWLIWNFCVDVKFLFTYKLSNVGLHSACSDTFLYFKLY